MNYSQTIDYLFTRLPMFSRMGAAAIKKDLTNTLALCDSLNNPQQHFKSIHIAGTNGKGSVSHMMAAILQTAGYKTGLYTSPHLKDFRERIKVNGEMVSEDFVVDFTQRIQPEIDRIEPSFFEITVAMAFEYFAQQQVDVAVIETGLGGRLDSTNIIHPDLSIITNIGWDHMNLLGNTLEAIASEKAGIIKKQVPVVIGEFLPQTKPVFQQKANEQHAAIVFAQEQLKVISASYKKQLKVLVADKSDQAKEYTLDLSGTYQQKNLLTVLTSVEQLRKLGYHITDEQLVTALQQVQSLTGLHGRWELIHEAPRIILDVAHNEDGIQQVLIQLKQMEYKHLHWIIGMVKDKEIDKVLNLLPADAHYYFTKAQIPRALPENELKTKAAEKRLSGDMYPNVNVALAQALTYASKDDLILVCGSVFLVGEVERSF